MNDSSGNGGDGSGTGGDGGNTGDTGDTGGNTGDDGGDEPNSGTSPYSVTADSESADESTTAKATKSRKRKSN